MYGHTHLDYSLYDSVWDLWDEKDGENLKQEVARARHFIEQMFAEIHELKVQISLMKGNRIIIGDLILDAVKKYEETGNIEELLSELRMLGRSAPK